MSAAGPLLSRAATACSGPSPPEFCSELAVWLSGRLSVVATTASSLQVPSAEGENFTEANLTLADYPSPPVLAAALSVLLGILILITVLGNVFVIAAILMERNLQNVANYLIVSLAVADLMVACLVMPLGAVYEISQGWILGPELCDMWTSSDVLCCTASILHLVAIAVDRYWAVTNVDYIHNRNGNRIIGMIALVWSVALVVSLAPQFGWKDPAYLERITQQQRCLVSQDIGYQIFATCSTFYVPLLVILILYWKIYQTARTRIRRRRTQQPSSDTHKHNFLTKKKKKKCLECEAGKARSVESVGGPSAFTISKQQTDRGRESLEAKRERKAAKTLAIITGAFVVCWLPFFITALLLPLCTACHISDSIASLFLWLGYCNSALNPVIYTVFSPEFRNAFKRILCGVSRPLRYVDRPSDHRGGLIRSQQQ